jgi:hypothetical protein
MKASFNPYLVCAGIATMTGGMIHLAAIFGGPPWYRFIGAPDSIVDLAVIGHPYPIVVCVSIASVLFVWACYAFSGARLIKRLPLLRTGLIAIAAMLIVRGVVFVPLMAWHPAIFVGICNCKGVDAFLIVTSAICLLVGLCYAVGTHNAWDTLNSRFANKPLIAGPRVKHAAH